MAWIIDRTTKQISTMDTVAARADPNLLVYEGRQMPQAVIDELPWYRVIVGEDVRVATAEERVVIDADIATQAAAAAAAQLLADKTQAKTEADTGKQPVQLIARAIVSLMLDQINVLRQKAGLAQLTPAQVKAALEAKIDAINGT